MAKYEVRDEVYVYRGNQYLGETFSDVESQTIVQELTAQAQRIAELQADLADARQRAEQAEAENERLRAALYSIQLNAPKSNREPSNPIEWSFWLAGKVARGALGDPTETPDTAPVQPLDSGSERYVVGRTLTAFRIWDTDTGEVKWQYTYKTEEQAQARADELNASDD